MNFVKIFAAVVMFMASAVSLFGASPTPAERRVALRDSISACVTGAQRPAATLLISDFGTIADGRSDCRPAFESAMKVASDMGGAVISVPDGTYFLKGPLTFVSNVTVDLSAGATLLFSPDASDYPIVETSWEGTFLLNYSPFIYGRNLENVAITGKGTIDGNAGATFAKWRADQKPGQMRSRDMNHTGVAVAERVFGDGYWLRPHLIQFYGCKGVTVEGVRIINSPFWCLHLLMSDNIICRGIRFQSRLVNNDGIDPDGSRGIIIEDIDFDNGDDNIAIKSGRDNDGWTLSRSSADILIRNCRFKGLHAVVIGSELSGGVENVVIENCSYGGYCKRGIYLKTNADRGAWVRNIFVHDCEFGDVEDLFYVTSRYASEGAGNTNFTRVSDLYVDGLRCRRASAAALVLQGVPSLKVSDVLFDNVEVGEARIGVSFENVERVAIGECHIGGHAGTPTQISNADRIFDR